jgi:uncharacterized phage-associated protein
MPYDPRAIANYFLKVAAEHDQSLDPMKLQKLVYFANGWHLAIKDMPLINEQVEAWPYGPVIPSLYRAFRKFGNLPVTAPAVRRDSAFEIVGVPDLGDVPDQAEFTRAFLNRIWDIYGGYTSIQLSNETHLVGSPWHDVLTEYHGAIPKRTDIPAGLMKRYFRTLARSRAEAQ